ncbi:glycine zipper 2TM domain-containing protein [Acidovorax sp. SUPP950]|uniref:glycine zipper 2TM domain-containing protein n=1 Tax=unclassified Acidovorax TaxID=2684926 RepID=UPI002348EF85|nr:MULTISPECIES: glycine zipper 2TM domain-containing protein [Comamonadaceae]WCM89711.1 glycine zipper 2TM domain-containing protein [Acidovorax sp. NCPPB 3576]WOI47655.1 glycine zipper 2TM domain-containing protein [Paracidovorax avenae]GKS75828.1 glycine zipper 2TM domain-containing protein [Acidovorax sp. SUPP950]GKS82593.1 glycine zipper 2TM domain-containing protein [Acidovorax sp. SUPP1855]GKS90488.1 glycine zipper 2TM domain-containing protein [Acidovorax sp. SUPP2539]
MSRFIRSATLAGSVALVTLLSACAQQPRYSNNYPAQPQPGYSSYPAAQNQNQNGTEFGVVSNIETLHARNRGTSGAGAVLGAVAGGVLGNQVGKGSGRAAATVLGAVGGGVVGNQIEGRTGNNNDGQAEGYRLTIQLDQGGQRVYDVTTPGDLRTGDRVRLYGGQISRI